MEVKELVDPHRTTLHTNYSVSIHTGPHYTQTTVYLVAKGFDGQRSVDAIKPVLLFTCIDLHAL